MNEERLFFAGVWIVIALGIGGSIWASMATAEEMRQRYDQCIAMGGVPYAESCSFPCKENQNAE